MALEESTDIADIYQLLIFVRIVDDQFSVREEFLDLVLFPISAKGSYIYNALLSVIYKFGGF